MKLGMVLSPSTRGSCGAFIGLGEDNQRYWIKPVNNAHGKLVPVTEQVVGRLGCLVGAPTCVVRTVAISPDFAGFEFLPGRILEAGIAHGSLEVRDASEAYSFRHHADDDNSTRHCWLLALYDWCWGGDDQWLVGRDFSYFSHDHGYYLPPEGPDWSSAELERHVDVPHPLDQDAHSVDAAKAEAVASRLESTTQDQLIAILAMIPNSWAVNDQDLESLGFFLARRAPQVATRLRQRFVG